MSYYSVKAVEQVHSTRQHLGTARSLHKALVFNIIRADLRNGCFSCTANLNVLITTELTYLLSGRVFLNFLFGTCPVQMAKDSAVPMKVSCCHTLTWSWTTHSCFTLSKAQVSR